ncbi:unnamed protein product [Mytilus edulis]|uniref:Uncharacterized protein n=1 Tax=Mytilus edulis TaxID=6550 RepID=A0A8S3T5W3_MYTED|nr:unnamed protein product [Mytilus edulis]
MAQVDWFSDIKENVKENDAVVSNVISAAGFGLVFFRSSPHFGIVDAGIQRKGPCGGELSVVKRTASSVVTSPKAVSKDSKDHYDNANTYHTKPKKMSRCWEVISNIIYSTVDAYHSGSDPVCVCAPTGIASYHIKGMAIHSALKLPVQHG